jgi:hypothetical protein
LWCSWVAHHLARQIVPAAGVHAFEGIISLGSSDDVGTSNPPYRPVLRTAITRLREDGIQHTTHSESSFCNPFRYEQKVCIARSASVEFISLERSLEEGWLRKCCAGETCNRPSPNSDIEHVGTCYSCDNRHWLVASWRCCSTRATEKKVEGDLNCPTRYLSRRRKA